MSGPGSKAVEPGHRSDSPPYCKPVVRLILVTVFVCCNPHLENAVSGVGRVFGCLHSTIYHSDLILIAAFHKEKSH